MSASRRRRIRTSEQRIPSPHHLREVLPVVVRGADVVEPVGARSIGARVMRVEDPRILTGRGQYVDDIVLPGMLHDAFFRSQVPHGLLRSVDVSAARALPGVVAVYTGEDLQRLTTA